VAKPNHAAIIMTKRYLGPEPTESERKMPCLEMRLANGNQKWKSKTGIKKGAGEMQELLGRGRDDPGNGLIQAVKLESA
jgi:hypothetical protein